MFCLNTVLTQSGFLGHEHENVHTLRYRIIRGLCTSKMTANIIGTSSRSENSVFLPLSADELLTLQLHRSEILHRQALALQLTWNFWTNPDDAITIQLAVTKPFTQKVEIRAGCSSSHTSIMPTWHRKNSSHLSWKRLQGHRYFICITKKKLRDKVFPIIATINWSL